VLKNPEIFYSAFDDKKKEYKKAMPWMREKYVSIQPDQFLLIFDVFGLL
jgi:hypothetical protein